MTDHTSGLNWDVYVAPAEPTVTDDLPPGETQRLWSPTSATLIAGERTNQQSSGSGVCL